MSFSEKEIEELKMLAYRMVSSPLQRFLLDAVEGRRKQTYVSSGGIDGVGAGNDDIDMAISLIKQLKVSEFIGHQEIAWPEHDLKLIIKLAAKVPRDHDLAVKVAKKYYKTIYDHIDKLVELTKVYYGELIAANVALAESLKKIFGEDARSLALNVANRTMFFNVEDNFRLGITCFYIDGEGLIVPVVDDIMLTTKKHGGGI
jgi:hypothetical protein